MSIGTIKYFENSTLEEERISSKPNTYLREKVLSEVEIDALEAIGLSLKEETKLTQMLNEAKQELDEASKNKDLSAESEAYDSYGILKPQFYASQSGRNSAHNVLFRRSETAKNRLKEAAIKVKTIEVALIIAQKRFDEIYDKATEINQLVDFILQNPNNGVISPNVKSPQKIADTLDVLDEELIQDLVTKRHNSEKMVNNLD